MAQDVAAPSGALSSVHGWERVGAALTKIIRVFLHVAVLRHVDDFFGPERY